MARKKITDEQLQEELNAGMKNVDIARKYGISDRVIRIRKAKLAKKGVGHGRDVSHLVPDGYKIKGTSSLVDEFGNTKLQWVKTDTDAERQVELMKAVIEGMKSEITPVAPVKAARAKRDDKLLNLYTVSDFHLGMLAWANESGDDWDMKIAEDLFSRWFDAAFQKAPDAGTGVINLLGDFAHFDSLDAVTPESRHVLDADTRYQKLVRYMIRMVRRLMIAISEQFIKPVFGDDYFGKYLAENLPDGDEVFVVSDGGFASEVAPIVAAGHDVRIVRLHRDGYTFICDSRGYLYDVSGVKDYDTYIIPGDVKSNVIDIALKLGL